MIRQGKFIYSERSRAWRSAVRVVGVLVLAAALLSLGEVSGASAAGPAGTSGDYSWYPFVQPIVTPIYQPISTPVYNIPTAYVPPVSYTLPATYTAPLTYTATPALTPITTQTFAAYTPAMVATLSPAALQVVCHQYSVARQYNTQPDNPALDQACGTTAGAAAPSSTTPASYPANPYP